ncbi:O-antigen ligase family protein [Thalassospiraceae bacterium LMO-JJ14]|nr:O-antigen ligase family protein [Thalassospiraceae bacterium LMO-JJ14]
MPLAIVAALALLGVAYKRDALKRIRVFDSYVLYALCAYFLTALLASLLNDALVDEATSLGKIIGLIVIAVLLFPMRSCLSKVDIQWVAGALILGLCITMMWIGGYILYEKLMYFISLEPERYNDDYFSRLQLYGYFWFKSASTVTALFSLVAGVYLIGAGKRLFALLFVCFGVLTCYWVGSRTAGYGLVGALVAGLTYQLLGRYRLKLVLAVLALAFLLPVWMNLSNFKPEQVSTQLNITNSAANAVVYRMYIWDFVADKIAEKPLLGWGVDASKRLGTDAEGVLSDPRFGKLGEPIPVHPHNAILQIWLDFGFFGAMFIYVLIARGLILAERHIHRPLDRIWIFACGSLIATLFSFSFSIASSWWMVTVIVGVVLTAMFARHASLQESAGMSSS